MSNVQRPENTMSRRTVFLSRLIGVYTVLSSLCLLASKQATVEKVTAIIHDPPALVIVGLVALGAGLAIILSHNVWSGGALPVIVTLVGWLLTIRGSLLLVLSPDAVPAFFAKIHFEQLFYLYFGIALILGVYLTYRGFSSTEGRMS